MTLRLAIQKLHTYTGLLTFINLMVYGLVGLSATWGPREPDPIPRVGYQPFVAAANSSDRDVAEQVCSLLRLSLATPIQKEVIQHDPNNRLLLDFWDANGHTLVTVLEPEGRLKIEEYRDSVWRYLGILHGNTAALRTGDRRMQIWAGYNEFAMWSLIGMMATGMALWLFTWRARRWVLAPLGAGGALFAAMYFWAR